MKQLKAKHNFWFLLLLFFCLFWSFSSQQHFCKSFWKTVGLANAHFLIGAKNHQVKKTMMATWIGNNLESAWYKLISHCLHHIEIEVSLTCIKIVCFTIQDDLQQCSHLGWHVWKFVLFSWRHYAQICPFWLNRSNDIAQWTMLSISLSKACSISKSESTYEKISLFLIRMKEYKPKNWIMMFRCTKKTMKPTAAWCRSPASIQIASQKPDQSNIHHKCSSKTK